MRELTHLYTTVDIFEKGLIWPSSSSLTKHPNFRNVGHEFVVFEKLTDELFCKQSLIHSPLDLFSFISDSMCILKMFILVIIYVLN